MLIIVQTQEGTNIIRSVGALEAYPLEGETLLAEGSADVAFFLESQYNGEAVLTIE